MIEIDLHHNGKRPVNYDWESVPNLRMIQGGESGVVISRKGNYRTAFVEVFADDTFIRGEGATLEEAETAAWQKLVKRISCPKHEWEPRGYKNGLGFCKYCNTTQSDVISPEQLGQFCHECGLPTLYSCDENQEKWGCEQHPVRNSAVEELLKAINQEEKEEE